MLTNIKLTNSKWAQLNTLSPSRINSFFSCGKKFEMNYIHKFQQPSGISAHRGSGVHKAIEEDNKHFKDIDKRLNIESLLEFGLTEFDEKIEKEGVFIAPKDEEKRDKIIEKARDQVVQAIRLYEGMEKPWMPAYVEEKVEADIGYPLMLNMRIDMIDTDNIIYDWKTYAKRTIHTHDIQSLLYCKAYEELSGYKPKFQYIDFILKKEPEIDIQLLPDPTPEHYKRLDDLIEIYFKAIEADIFLPASKFDFLCSENGCAFWKQCEYRF